MRRADLVNLMLSVALMAVAGCVDAIGFLKLGDLFVSFMSGDTTQLAVAASRGDAAKAARAAGVVGLFVLGVMAGRGVSRAGGAWGRPAVLGVEALLLGLAVAIGPSTRAVIAPMILAMGVQNAAVHKAGQAKMSLTYVTGTLVNLGEGLVDALAAPDRQARWAWAPYLLLWVGLVIGAGLGAIAYQAWAMRALLAPALAAAGLCGLTGLAARQGRTLEP